MIKAGRDGAAALDMDGINVTENIKTKTSFLDIHTDFYIEKTSSLNFVNPMATANEPIGFQGCVWEVIINNQELQLPELEQKVAQM